MKNLNYYKNYDYKNSVLSLKLIRNVNDTLNIIMYIGIIIGFCQLVRLVIDLYYYFH